MVQVDFLIIGQGLAGSLLAWELIKRDCSFIIVDNGQENASQIAAGLVNPITGMRFVKMAGIDDLLPVAKICYEQLADYFQQTFYIEKPMMRLFGSHRELRNCLVRLQNPEYQDYCERIGVRNELIEQIEATYGYLQ